MKPTTFMRVLFLFLLAGCATRPLWDQNEYDQVRVKYRSIHKGMTKEELIARLGPPDQVYHVFKRSLVWKFEKRSGPHGRLEVLLDQDDRVIDCSNYWWINDPSDPTKPSGYPVIPDFPVEQHEKLGR